MKFHSGQTVVLLTTEYKPAGNAVIKGYNEIADQYEVDYKYPGNENAEQLLISEERLRIAEFEEMQKAS